MACCAGACATTLKSKFPPVTSSMAKGESFEEPGSASQPGLSTSGTNGHVTWLAQPNAPQSCFSLVQGGAQTGSQSQQLKCVWSGCSCERERRGVSMVCTLNLLAATWIKEGATERKLQTHARTHTPPEPPPQQQQHPSCAHSTHASRSLDARPQHAHRMHIGIETVVTVFPFVLLILHPSPQSADLLPFQSAHAQGMAPTATS